MQIPGLGSVVKDSGLGWYVSAPIPVPVLGRTPRRIIVDGYDGDPAKDDIHAAIGAFLTLDRSVLAATAPSIFAYYRHVMDDVVADGDDDWYVEIESPSEAPVHARGRRSSTRPLSELPSPSSTRLRWRPCADVMSTPISTRIGRTTGVRTIAPSSSTLSYVETVARPARSGTVRPELARGWRRPV